MKSFIKNAIIVVTVVIGLSSCSKVNYNNLKYDENLEIYKLPINQYNSIFLRNTSDRLIDKNNIDSFLVATETKGFKPTF